MLNDSFLRDSNLGAYHCGVEVLGDEWSYMGFHDAWDNPNISGVVQNEPRKHRTYLFKETVYMGETHLAEEDVDHVIERMMDTWPACKYHIVTNNCTDFARELLKQLKCPLPFPDWVRGAADAGASPELFPFADYAWSLVRG
jgi:hypothetical protein